ncbi:hypothetical protein [Ammoniphilus sp. 3BR4]|uniref:hypothetical protein n=1 Tax=Ammoniphilus sp. 3BR4 TaxID=3158265 RepID=UPI003466EB27
MIHYYYRCDFCGAHTIHIFISRYGNYICSSCTQDKRNHDRFDDLDEDHDNVTYEG